MRDLFPLCTMEQISQIHYAEHFPFSFHSSVNGVSFDKIYRNLIGKNTLDRFFIRISQVPTDNFYAVKLELPNGLISNYGNSFEFNREIQGTAEIITEDLRLIQRIFNPIRALFHERVAL